MTYTRGRSELMLIWDQGDLLFVRSTHSGYEQIGLAFLRCQFLASDLWTINDFS